MFSNNDFYHLDEAEKIIRLELALLEIYVQAEALKAVLIQKGTTSEDELLAAENYVKNKPQVTETYNNLEQAAKRIHQYKNNPQQHMKDLFAAKLNGTIK